MTFNTLKKRSSGAGQSESDAFSFLFFSFLILFLTVSYLLILDCCTTMAKKALVKDQFVKLIVGAGQASPSPPVGPALGSRGVKSMDFCKVWTPSSIVTQRWSHQSTLLAVGIQCSHSTHRPRHPRASARHRPARPILHLRPPHPDHHLPPAQCCQCRAAQEPPAWGSETGPRVLRQNLAQACLRNRQDQAVRDAVIGPEFAGPVQERHCAGQVGWHPGCSMIFMSISVFSGVFCTISSIIYHPSSSAYNEYRHYTASGNP